MGLKSKNANVQKLQMIGAPRLRRRYVSRLASRSAPSGLALRATAPHRWRRDNDKVYARDDSVVKYTGDKKLFTKVKKCRGAAL